MEAIRATPPSLLAIEDLRCLREAQSEAALEMALRALHHPSLVFRREALSLLQHWNPPDIALRVRCLPFEPDSELRRELLQWLAQLGPLTSAEATELAMLTPPRRL